METEQVSEFEPPLVEDDNKYSCKDGEVRRGKKWVVTRVCHDCSAEVGAAHKKSCNKYHAAWMEYTIPRTDLRSITRSSDKIVTVIELVDRYDRRRHTWILCGSVNLRTNDRRPGDVELTCYLTAGVTDFEHDSAYAFQLPLIGWTFDSIYYSAVSFTAWVHPEIDRMLGFRVPGPGYNPMEDDDIYECKDGSCAEDPHLMVPEGLYIAPHNPELYEKVKGKKVRITIRPAWDKEESNGS